MSIKKQILATLTYFSLFEYPLKKGEIFMFLSNCNDSGDFEQCLFDLVHEDSVFKVGDFYSLNDDIHQAIKRIKGNERAAVLLKKADRVAALISAFPFVEGVAVSGSLSKHYADEKSDIDFFIITSADRLWIARSILHIFKKFTFLLNMQEYFCMNYFIDEADPVIREKNIYTAMELATMMPLRGNRSFEKFFRLNSWARNFFPNKYLLTSGKKLQTNWFRRAIEKIMSGRLGDKLEVYLMELTNKSWNREKPEPKKNSRGEVLTMHIGKHFSKPNPGNFQRNLLLRYEKKLHEVYTQHDQLTYYPLRRISR